MESQINILAEVEPFVEAFFREHIPKEYVYHDFQHTQYVVEAALEIAEPYDLSEQDLEILQIAAWFHDVGYSEGAENHEERGCSVAKNFLVDRSYPVEDIDKVLACIMATKMSSKPNSLLEEILRDADLSHLGNLMYWDRCGRVRQELLLTKDIVMSEQEWVDFELNFITNHQYYTIVAKDLYDKRKRKHIKQLWRQKLRLDPKSVASIDILFDDDKKKKKKKKKKKGLLKGDDMELKQINLGRGVETMFRTTYRTHVNLSSIADNKANIMLSINAIIISIVVANLVPQFSENKLLVWPTLILLGVCLTALVFAILSTRPKVTEGKFTREDIENKQANLLFFGNFYNMKIDDFHLGMMEMIKDSDFLYSSMTRDIYYLGVVLAKKYRFLRICYGVFMYGLILSVLAFAVVFSFSGAG